jgi:hypothetical protein
MTAKEKDDLQVPELTSNQKTNIIQNFFIRVPNASRRIKIQRLALTMSDFNENSDDYFALLNFYSLQENWSTIDKDYEEFYIPGYSGENNRNGKQPPQQD